MYTDTAIPIQETKEMKSKGILKPLTGWVDRLGGRQGYTTICMAMNGKAQCAAWMSNLYLALLLDLEPGQPVLEHLDIVEPAVMETCIGAGIVNTGFVVPNVNFFFFWFLDFRY